MQPKVNIVIKPVITVSPVISTYFRIDTKVVVKLVESLVKVIKKLICQE